MAENKRVTPKGRREIAERLADRDAAQWDKEGFSYPMALSLTRNLESRRGFDTLVSLLDRLAEGEQLDSALRRYYGEDYAAICRRWKLEMAREGGR
jgi:hypothetical protein